MEKTAAESGRMVSRLSDFGEVSAIASLRDLTIPPTDISTSGIAGFFCGRDGCGKGVDPGAELLTMVVAILESRSREMRREELREFKLLREGMLRGSWGD